MASASKRLEAHWLEKGTALWERFLREKSGADPEQNAWGGIFDLVDQFGTGKQMYPDLPDNEGHRAATLDGYWCAKWVESGSVILETTESYAAALSCTRAAREIAEDIRVPAQAFIVRLPPGLYPSGRPGHPWLNRARCLCSDGRSSIILHAGDGPAAIYQDDGSVPFLEILFDDAEIPRSADTVIDEEVLIRSIAMVHRMIAGLLFTVTHTTNWRDKEEPTGRGISKRHGPPTHRHIVIGRSMSINMAPAVRDAIRGGGTSPSYQTMTRGHYRRQPVGVGRTGRKVIWIEPYWRGPEDALILTRPYRVCATNVRSHGCNDQ